jgi:N-acetylmuramoyl-L-alanine amidase
VSAKSATSPAPKPTGKRSAPKRKLVPFKAPRRDRLRKVERLILHHTVGEHVTVESITKDHQKRGWVLCGYHWLIGSGNGLPDGHIAAARPVGMVGAAVKNRNSGNVYVALAGDLTKHPPTKKQLFALGHWLLINCVRYNVHSHNVLGHKEWALESSPTACPGTCLDLMAIRAWLHENLPAARKSEPVESLADYMERLNV